MKAHGADVKEGSERVRFDADMILELISHCPSEFTLHARNPAHNLRFGGDNLILSMMASAPNCSDLDRGRRPGNQADYRNFLRLAQMHNILNCTGGYPVEPIDIHPSVRHLECIRDLATLTDKVFHIYSLGKERNVDGIEIARLARGISREQLQQEPSVFTIINTNSPLRLDIPMMEGIIQMSSMGQVVVVTPFTLSGAMAPVTIAGALVQQNAEALAGISFAQMVKKGAPVGYGGFTSNVDMKSGAPAFGTPENTKANVASGQLARRYNLPYRTTPGSASNAADAQGAYETMMALWGAVLGHGNLVYHAAGWQEGGLTASLEKFIIDVEMIQHIMEFLRPIAVDEAELAVEALGRVPTGGHFFGEPHTLERYATAFYQPMLSNWQNYEAWREAGSLDATARATRLWKKALEEYVEPAMDADVREALEAYMARRREAIGQGEP